MGNHITACALVVGYGLSKFAGNEPRKNQLIQKMGKRSLAEVYRQASLKFEISKRSVSNAKDSFDPLFENLQKGWDDEGTKKRYNQYKTIVENHLKDYDIDEYAKLLNYFLYGDHNKNNTYDSLLLEIEKEINSDSDKNLENELKKIQERPKNGVDEEEQNNSINYLLPYSRTLTDSKNIILHGAPGTGKSYLAKQIAADIVSDGKTSIYSELTPDKKKQIEFVQFHPSYDYTDFVEGLRPKLNDDGSMGFELRDGIFMKFVNRARKNYEDSQKSDADIQRAQSAEEALIDFINSIDFEKEEKEKNHKLKNGNKFYITNTDENYIYARAPENDKNKDVTIQIEDIRKMLESEQEFNQVRDVREFFDKKNQTRAHSYDLAIYKEITSKRIEKKVDIKKEEEKKYVFIIDEINRGEISKIFGELFYSIDPGYRGKAGEISTQYANLHSDPNEKFYIPDNVYIIGTMNDIDRSVDSFDFAMRRRFRFVELKADEMTGMLDSLETMREDAEARMKRLNEAIIKFKSEGLNENYQIGAAYFLKLNEINVDQLWSDYLEPLLKDYIQGMPNEEEILTSFKNAYNGEETPNGVNVDANSEG